MEKYKLKDFTFIIPIRVDSIERLENIITVTSYLSQYFETNIYLLEAATRNNSLLKTLLGKDIEYYYLEDHDTIFYKTKYINILSRKVKTQFMAIWDADVITDPQQIINAVEKLRNNEADMAYPYNGVFLECSEIIRSLYLDKKDIGVLHRYSHMMNLPYGNSLKSGTVLLNLEKFVESGMTNEKFYGWGNEDYELYHRSKVLGYKIFSSNGPIFHLSHPRDQNGRFRSSNQVNWTRSQLNMVINSSKEDLRSLIIRNLPDSVDLLERN